MRAVKSSRRAVVGGSIAAVLAARLQSTSAQTASPAFSLPIGLPGDALGDGFLIRHGYATENTWYNPSWWHTGEDWYLLEGNTASANVYAVADGTVVFAGSDYPGLVVIVRHADDLYSMYGHLDEDLAVAGGDAVTRGQFLGRVLDRTDGRAPSHLHFEMRTFLTTPVVNGNAPRYDVGCGFECPPGPGYWPIDAPEHPSEIGWRNPTHVIARRAYPGSIPEGTEVVVAGGASDTVALWSLPSDRADGVQIGNAPVAAGERFNLTAVATGPENSTRTSADGYRLWYRIALPDGDAWARAAVPSTGDTGSDGRPSSVRFQFLPAISAT
jgi:murein DD-endopeptidase MepM/ murein hydrolase activator NlpD